MAKSLEMVEITREQAEHWLGATNLQRSIQKKHVRNLQADMQAGNWHPELAPPILIDEKTDEVIDGQHRLKAFLNTKKHTLETYLAKVPRKAIQVVDTGRTRSLIDTLDIRGHENSKHKSAWLNRSVQWITGVRSSHHMTRTEQVACIEAAPHLEKAAEIAHQYNRVGGRKVYRVPPGTVATLWDMQQYGLGSDWVEEFVRRIQSSEDMDELLARAQAKLVDAVNPRTKATFTADAQSYLIARVFNAWVNEEDISRLYARRAAIRDLPGFREWAETNFDKYLDL